ITRCLSGVPTPILNAVIGHPKSSNWESCIEEQLKCFKQAKLPFIWYVDEMIAPEHKKKMFDYGFQDIGIFKGVIGPLAQAIPHPQIPDDCIFQLVEDETSLEEFNQLVCSIFEINGVSIDLFKKGLWNATRNDQ